MLAYINLIGIRAAISAHHTRLPPRARRKALRHARASLMVNFPCQLTIFANYSYLIRVIAAIIYIAAHVRKVLRLNNTLSLIIIAELPREHFYITHDISFTGQRYVSLSRSSRRICCRIVRRVTYFAPPQQHQDIPFET